MTSEVRASALPPGPWRYRPGKHDDWGMVSDAEGNPVANTCPPGVAQDFKDALLQQEPNVTLCKAGPPQSLAVAELLIRAERELDETPVDEAWLREIGVVFVSGYDANVLQINRLLFCKQPDGTFAIAVPKKYAATRGQLRTLARAIGISLTTTERGDP